MPRITLIMPSFNQAAYLEEAICSILNQNYPNLEFMIFDGGSTDGSKAIIEKYTSKLAYWRSGPDRGQSDAIAQGFALAQGDLLGWVNSDDALLPGCLKAIAQAYRENPRGGIFGGHYVLMDEFSHIIRCKRHAANAGWFAEHALFAINPGGSFFKRVDYETVGGLNLDLHYVMDTDLYIRMIFNGTQYVHIDKYLSLFRIHGDQKTSAQRSKTQEEGQRLGEEIWLAELRRYAGEKRWRLLYRLWQTLNGNYLRMHLETLRLKGRHWKSISWENPV